jgi:YesN/AraC family two-component response regulator
MRLFDSYRTRKYLRSIFIYVALLMIAFLSVSSFTLYYNSQQTILQLQQESNRKILTQIKNNMESMNEIVKNVAITVFFDTELIPLLYSNEKLSLDEKFPKLLKLDKYVNSMSFLQSIAIYNGSNGEVYSTDDSIRYDVIEMKFKDINNDLPKRLAPMSLPSVKNPDEKVRFFTYFMYQDSEKKDMGIHMLMLNVKPEWIFDNVKYINQLTDVQKGTVFIMDKSGNVFYPAGKQNDAEIRAAVQDRFAYANNESDYFTYNLNGRQQMISYLSTDVNDWKVVIVQPKDAFLNRMERWRNISLIFIGSFIVLSVMFAIFVSKRLYNPIEKLLRQIGTADSPNVEPKGGIRKDEISYMSEVFKQTLQKIDHLEQEQDRKKHTLKQYHLRRLITESHQILLPEVQSLILEHGLGINAEGRFVLCLASIYRFRELQKTMTEKEWKLYKFAITNIAGEIMSEVFQNEIVDMKTDHLIMLIEVGETPDHETRLQGLLQKIQATIKEYYKLSLSLTLSERTSDIRSVSNQYACIFKLSQYRLVFDREVIILPSMVQVNENAEFQVPTEMEKKLLEAIRANDELQFKETVNRLLEMISKLSYDNIVHTLVHLVFVINQTVNEMNANRVNPIQVGLNSIYQEILEKETLADVLDMLTDLFHAISQETREGHDSRNQTIIDTIKEIIEDHYMEINISLQSVAKMMKMSPTYLGRIFKKNESISLAEYINEVRLKRAVELLENKNISVNEIWEKVGYANRSYFFKLFKSKYGTTPREYRLKKSMF